MIERSWRFESSPGHQNAIRRQLRMVSLAVRISTRPCQFDRPTLILARPNADHARPPHGRSTTGATGMTKRHPSLFTLALTLLFGTAPLAAQVNEEAADPVRLQYLDVFEMEVCRRSPHIARRRSGRVRSTRLRHPDGRWALRTVDDRLGRLESPRSHGRKWFGEFATLVSRPATAYCIWPRTAVQTSCSCAGWTPARRRN